MVVRGTFHAQILTEFRVLASLAPVHHTNDPSRARLSSDHDVVQVEICVREADSRVVWQQMSDGVGKPLLHGYPIQRPELQSIIELPGVGERANVVAVEIDRLYWAMI